MEGSTSRCPEQQLQKESFKILSVLGEGTFGKVFKCVEQSTEKTVAIKFDKKHMNLYGEVQMLKALMHKNMDRFNIIAFYGMCNLHGTVGLVFEMLDISLQDYLIDLKGPMRLEDVRIVMEQMATAFDALKRVGIIHADVKIDNIMMVDHKRQPFRVKLIDFGMAVFRSEATFFNVFQTPFYRSPEIMFGNSFSEAIDMWSLGCVMAVMLFGCMLFPAMTDYEAIQQIVDLLGPPPDHLLHTGWKSARYFKRTVHNKWILKTPVEYYNIRNDSEDFRYYTFRSLDQAKEMRLEKDNKTEAEDREQSIELLKAILTWDQKVRITPLGTLNHPFITKSYLQRRPHLNTWCCACDESQESMEATTSTGQAEIWINKTKEATLSDEDSTSFSLSHGVIMVQPAASENRIQLKESADLENEMSCHPAEARLPDLVVTSIDSDTASIDSDATSIDSDATSIDSDATSIDSDATSIDSDATSIDSDATSIDSDETSIDSDDTSIDFATGIYWDIPTISLDTISLCSDGTSKKKKKNRMKRFFSWMKRRFCCCCSVDDVLE